MKDIFRKNAVMDMSSPEQLNKYICLISTPAWVITVALFAATAGVIVWAFAGSLTSVTEVYGVFFTEGGIVNVNPAAPGYVSEIRVRVGDYVKAGDLLAVIPQTDIIDEISRLRKEGADNGLIEELISEYRYLSFVYAKNDGRITELAEERAHISVDGKVASVMVQNRAGSSQEICAFVPASMAERLEPGMEAQVSPLFAPRERYGYMIGYISDIGAYPVTNENINDGLMPFVKDILPETSFVEVKITLLSDAESDNLIKWSNANGHDLSVDMGTTCSIMIVTGKSRPLDRLF